MTLIAVFWQDLISVYRDMLVVKTTRDAARYLDLTDAEAAALAAVWQEHGVSANGSPTVDEAMRAAVTKAKQSGLPLFILGSLYLYREARDAFDALSKQ